MGNEDRRAGQPAARSRRGPYAKGMVKRAEILDAALQLFAESGGQGPSLRRIATQVNLAEASVLRYFGGMDNLLTAVLQARDEAAVLDFDLSTADQLFAYMASTTRTPGLTRLYVRLLAAAADPAHPAAAFFTEHHRQVAELIRVVLNPISDPDVELIISATEGLQARWLLDPQIDIIAELQRLVQALRVSQP